MPRPCNPGNAAGRAAQERYRTRIRAAGRPEVDAVDTAIAAAVAVYGFAAQAKRSDSDLSRFEALERMAVNFLVSRGKRRDQAILVVRRRLRRQDVDCLIPMVNDPS